MMMMTMPSSPWSMARFLALILGITITCFVSGSSADTADTNALPVVNLGYEIHQASYNSTAQYYNFTNIRYGAPPLGPLRFSSPVPPSSPAGGPPFTNGGPHPISCQQTYPAWTALSAAWEVNGTAALGNISAGYQTPNIPVNPAQQPADPSFSEDCLFLDVMVPKKVWENRGKGAAVMVWIHGGGYTLGSKTLYSPSAAGLLKASQSNGDDGIIWVAMNYRLGIFGFLSGPTFQSQSGTSNAGLLDQRLALDWVQKNIHLFGGSPSRVTLMGESAGGGSTFHQITAYGGLKGPVPFQQAIVQSPGFQMSPSPVLQEGIFENFLETAGVGCLEEARGLDTKVLMAVNARIVGMSSPFGTFTFNPVVDGSFAPALPGKLLLQGGYDTTLKIMAGHNLDEGYNFMDAYAQTEAVFESDFRIYFPTITDAQIQYLSKTLYPPIFNGSYPYTTQTGRVDLMISEGFFTCSTNYLARAYKNQTYNYIFSVPPSLHGDDIPYTYYNGPGPATGVQNTTLATMMQDYFTSFVLTGNPNRPGLPNFPQYGAGAMSLNLNLTFVDTVHDTTANERCLWWQKGLYY